MPKRRKGFYKFWWDQELKQLKQDSTESNKAWKAVDKPRSGPFFSKRQSCRLICHKRLKENQRTNTEFYTNDLHDALLKKSSNVFWQCWHYKFESTVSCKLIEGSVDPDVTAGKFASYFTSIFSCNDPQKANSIKHDYDTLRANYSGLLLNENHNIHCVSKK